MIGGLQNDVPLPSAAAIMADKRRQTGLTAQLRTMATGQSFTLPATMRRQLAVIIRREKIQAAEPTFVDGRLTEGVAKEFAVAAAPDESGLPPGRLRVWRIA